MAIYCHTAASISSFHWFDNPGWILSYGPAHGVDSETFSYYHDLSEKLITSLDKLLKRNNIDTTAFNSFKIQGNTGKNSTSYKIAAAFVEGLRARA
jgi:hypothetical protein